MISREGSCPAVDATCQYQGSGQFVSLGCFAHKLVLVGIHVCRLLRDGIRAALFVSCTRRLRAKLVPRRENKQGFSRVTWCSKCHGSGRVGSGRVQNLTGRVGSGQEVLNLVGRVRSGQDFSNLTGRVGSRGDENLTGWVRL